VASVVKLARNRKLEGEGEKLAAVTSFASYRQLENKE